ncbi:MAG: type IX secretion system outer membrane channel protein PorV [Sphingobacteriaceae bacterium]
MKPKKCFLLALNLLLVSVEGFSQTSDRAISTAMSFLLTRPDARSSAMGDVGVATTADAYSMYANPSKIVFAKHQIQAGLSYVPLMRNLAKDVSLVNFSGFKKLNDQNALGGSIYYLSYGQVDLTDANGQFIQNYYPVEYTLDFTFSRKMSNNFSMGLTARYLHSNTRFEKSDNNLVADPASAFATDVSMFYKLPLIGSTNEGEWGFGLMISNIGTKVHYHSDRSEFLPTNLKFGAAYSFMLPNGDQKLTFSTDFNKLLVPTPPEYDNNGQIVDGKDPDRSVVSALFTSFADAPGGFSEELSELSIGTGIECLFNETFAVRTGYFYENPKKGNRQHFTIGTGLQYRDFNFDLGYIIPTANRFVLRNNVKFSIGYNLK